MEASKNALFFAIRKDPAEVSGSQKENQSIQKLNVPNEYSEQAVKTDNYGGLKNTFFLHWFQSSVVADPQNHKLTRFTGCICGSPAT